MALVPSKILNFEALFGNTNSRKVALKELSAEYRQRLEEKMEDLEIDAKRVGKQALVIGGSIAAVYLLLQLLLPDDEPEIKTLEQQVKMPIIIEKQSSGSSWVTKAVSSLVLSWALEIARQKLMEFLATQQQTNEVKNTNETTG